MNRVIAIIATLVAFTVSSLNAGAGYSFHFDLPKIASIPLDAYVSSMLPDNVRASQEYRDELYKFKKVMGIKTPILVKSEKLEGMAIASAENVGLPYLRYSIIRLDKDKFKQSSSAFNIETLAHEMGHVKNNHFGLHNALRMLKIQDRDKTYEQRKKAEYEAETDGVACLARCGYAHVIKANLDHYKLCLKNTFHARAGEPGREKEALQKSPYAQWPEEQLNTYLDNTEALLTKTREEWQADIEKMLRLEPKNDSPSWFSLQRWKDVSHDQAMRSACASEYAGALASIIYQILHLAHLGDHTRPYTHYYIYPTIAEAITYTSKGLTDCLANITIDPRTTQDTPNLMRNGKQ